MATAALATPTPTSSLKTMGIRLGRLPLGGAAADAPAT